MTFGKDMPAFFCGKPGINSSQKMGFTRSKITLQEISLSAGVKQGIGYDGEVGGDFIGKDKTLCNLYGFKPPLHVPFNKPALKKHYSETLQIAKVALRYKNIYKGIIDENV